MAQLAFLSRTTECESKQSHLSFGDREKCEEDYKPISLYQSICKKFRWMNFFMQ